MLAARLDSPPPEMRRLAKLIFLLLVVFLVPLGMHAAWWYAEGRTVRWQAGAWDATDTAPRPDETEEAVVLVYAGRLGTWRGIFAMHCWIAVKPEGADAYTRYEVLAWGQPVRVDAYAPDARWAGNDPVLVADIRGETAAAAIPRIEAAVAEYPFADYGTYRSWPGPNSNTFATHLISAAPELHVALPSTAMGKDYPAAGDWLDLTPSRTGVALRLGGYAGLTLGWVEGIEINILGLVAGIDIRRPAVKLPGIGRLGF